MTNQTFQDEQNASQNEPDAIIIRPNQAGSRHANSKYDVNPVYMDREYLLEQIAEADNPERMKNLTEARKETILQDLERKKEEHELAKDRKIQDDQIEEKRHSRELEKIRLRDTRIYSTLMFFIVFGVGAGFTAFVFTAYPGLFILGVGLGLLPNYFEKLFSGRGQDEKVGL